MNAPGSMWDAAYSPDGRRIAVSVTREGRPAEVRILDATTGQQLQALRGHAVSSNRHAFSPDGTRLAAASDDGTARLWDLATGRELLALRGHAAAVVDVAFSPDGKRLISNAVDRTVRAWDLATGRELGYLVTHNDWM